MKKAKVQIKQVTLGKKDLGKIKVYDTATGKTWANETFDTYDEAKQFCDDNKLEIVGKPDVKIILEQSIRKHDTDTEDGGEAKIADVYCHVDKQRNEDENGIFVRLISNCPDKSHHDFNALIGRKVRITIEAID